MKKYKLTVYDKQGEIDSTFVYAENRTEALKNAKSLIISQGLISFNWKIKYQKSEENEEADK